MSHEPHLQQGPLEQEQERQMLLAPHPEEDDEGELHEEERGKASAMSAYRSPGAAELPFHEYVRQQLAGVKEIEIFPRPDRLAKLRFSIGAESPLVLVDDTVMSSCKAGILLTTHAIYMLIDGRRVELSIIRGGPYHPRGEDEAGYIDTTQGAFPFAAFTQA
jgi:hypothetical protein